MRDFESFSITLIFLAPVVGVLASVWPLEAILLKMLCVGLLLVALLATVAAKTLRHQLLGVGAIAVLLSTLVLSTPLQMAFRFSRPALDRAADRLAAEKTVQTPFWAGSFRICKAELNQNGVVCLWTDDSPNGRTGLVRHAPTGLPFNLWSHTVLDEDWQLIHED